MQEKCSEHFN